ncbi:MAG: LysM peptidoglycan-binding domain-containing protein [Bacteroidia bacterium]|nr:LysM peptidoglycan-binding domain-containing protein [Bacteroidia bacterium]
MVAFTCKNTWAQVMSTQEYIDAYKYAAMQEMKVYNIPASITLSQGILESASGNSKLATQCNNHFGIKCRKEWTGQYCLADDDAPNECFRGYPSAMDSYRDHSLFLKNGSRYNGLFALQITDYQGWANGLRAAGYATNPAYAKTLIGVIEKYRLSMYDSMVVLGEDYMSPDTAAQRVITKNGLPAVFAKAGQTPDQIARENELGTWQIYKYNDLKRGESLDPGEIVYLKPKKRSGTVLIATVKEGETMRDISQEYGIKLKHLYKKNHLKPGQQVRPGEILSLQAKNPVTPQTVETVAPKAKPAPEVKPVPKTNSALDKEFHEVKPGETLFSIAAKYGVTVQELMLWNKLSSEDLKAGQLLVLKDGDHSSGRSDTTGKSNIPEIKNTLKFHTVLSGETLYSISKLYNQPVDSIIKWNNLKSNSLSVGQELVVSPTVTKAVNNPKTYTVQAGDTLYSISRRFGISVAEIRRLNRLTNDNLAVGSTLVLQ